MVFVQQQETRRLGCMSGSVKDLYRYFSQLELLTINRIDDVIIGVSARSENDWREEPGG